MRSLIEVAGDLGLRPDEPLVYGGALKIPVARVRSAADRPRRGRLILVTATTPTPQGEGKTVTAIGLAMALRARGLASVVCLRQPSMGPVFGVKGGATGGGRATVEPQADINLGFTGDLDAAAAAQNLLAALIDNHRYHQTPPPLDDRTIEWPRALDVEDRALRRIEIGRSPTGPWSPRESRFVITAASEVTAILGLARDYRDLKARLGRVRVGSTTDGRLLRGHDFGAEGAMAALLRRAMAPNLVQTSDGTPALIHGGPFGNIAHGTASRLAIEFALATADFVVVEAGFATDLGAEKFVDLVAPMIGVEVSAGVLVTTIRALRHQGQTVPPDGAGAAAELARGLENLAQHLENLATLRVAAVVALNRWGDETPEEIATVRRFCEARGVPFTLSDVYRSGAEGAFDLAEAVRRRTEEGIRSRPLYGPDDSAATILDRIVRRIYGGKGAVWSEEALAQLERLRKDGEPDGPLCVAKTALSLSADPRLRGRPSGFEVPVRAVTRSAGAGFTVVHLGSIETMPGLPKAPASRRIDLADDGTVLNLP
ncbi:MAG: formate--tetrahydrofolate ligase [Thermoplasmata archaeon]|jgi:formate--tetrahydrofolate ligase